MNPLPWAPGQATSLGQAPASASSEGLLVALVGAESTGKTQLAQALAQALAQEGERACWVGEYLREFCEAQGRTPTPEEQWHIAREQMQRLEAARASHRWVVADTTPLMTALYSQWVYSDLRLLPDALSYQRRCSLTLMTTTDLPWVADGIMRDSPLAQRGIDSLLRLTLHQAGLAYSVITGEGHRRLACALRSLNPLRRAHHSLRAEGAQAPAAKPPQTRAQASEESAAPPAGAGPASLPLQARGRWTCWCEDCDDPRLEALHFSRLTGAGRPQFSVDDPGA
jgi:nicotinamide riboside kinase